MNLRARRGGTLHLNGVEPSVENLWHSGISQREQEGNLKNMIAFR
jgi:hypothetical protein